MSERHEFLHSRYEIQQGNKYNATATAFAEKNYQFT